MYVIKKPLNFITMEIMAGPKNNMNIYINASKAKLIIILVLDPNELIWLQFIEKKALIPTICRKRILLHFYDFENVQFTK